MGSNLKVDVWSRYLEASLLKGGAAKPALFVGSTGAQPAMNFRSRDPTININWEYLREAQVELFLRRSHVELRSKLANFQPEPCSETYA